MNYRGKREVPEVRTSVQGLLNELEAVDEVKSRKHGAMPSKIPGQESSESHDQLTRQDVAEMLHSDHYTPATKQNSSTSSNYATGFLGAAAGGGVAWFFGDEATRYLLHHVLGGSEHTGALAAMETCFLDLQRCQYIMGHGRF